MMLAKEKQIVDPRIYTAGILKNQMAKEPEFKPLESYPKVRHGS